MTRHRLAAGATRFLLLFAFWLLLLSPESLSPAAIGLDLAVGAIAAAAAALFSLRLTPPSVRTPRPWLLFRLLLRFLWQSLIGGLDVARRALDPRMPMTPGIIRHQTRMRSGPARALFGALTSQVPGTLAIGSEQTGELLYHCLDPDPGVAHSLATDEALFRAALSADESDRREGSA